MGLFIWRPMCPSIEVGAQCALQLRLAPYANIGCSTLPGASVGHPSLAFCIIRSACGARRLLCVAWQPLSPPSLHIFYLLLATLVQI